MNSTLDSIGLKFGTDKASSHHDYLRFYEGFLSHLRQDTIRILEVGVFGGSSLRTWAEYFPNATIVGADIQPASRRFETSRIKIEILDQSNVEELTRAAVLHGPFDIIIEDGSHMCEHQITSLKTLFPFLRNGGIYVAEDLQTNYGKMLENFRGVSSITCVDYLKQWLDLRVADSMIDINTIEDPFLRTYGRGIDFMVFYRRACLIKKNTPVLKRDFDSGEPIDTISPLALPVTILGHLSFAGDVIGRQVLNPKGDRFQFQGISLMSGLATLECKVQFADTTWTDWLPEEAFAGKKGQSLLITGVAVRAGPGFTVETLVRFADNETVSRAIDGEECSSPVHSPICGIQIELKRV